MSASFIPITSDTGETSNFAATLGITLFPNAEAPAIIWVKLNCFWEANINGVNLSGKKPSKAALSATNTFLTPPTLATCSAT